MKVSEGLTKPSEWDKVDAYMNNLKHPLAGVAKALREIILKTDPEIGEEIKWNAPAFFYAGELPPFNPKDYKRHIVVFNFYKQDCNRSKGEGQVWFARGRLSRRAQTSPVSRHERGRIPKGNLAATRQAVARHPRQALDQNGSTGRPILSLTILCDPDFSF
jgi:hypothetical protein